MKNILASIAIFLVFCSCENDCVQSTNNKVTKYLDKYTLAGEKSYYDGYEAMNSDSTFNAVIEIPAGTDQKWEVDKETGYIIWEIKGGSHRIVNYISYPANYGMIPKTLLPKDQGGDGDPIDVVVLGQAIDRGKVVKIRIIGMIKLLDGGEKDDKLIGIMDNTQFSDVLELVELDEQFPGVTAILSTWFSNYKGAGEMEFTGFGTRNEALNALYIAVSAFSK
jgi:inorganic pyrophosphatase